MLEMMTMTFLSFWGPCTSLLESCSPPLQSANIPAARLVPSGLPSGSPSLAGLCAADSRAGEEALRMAASAVLILPESPRSRDLMPSSGFHGLLQAESSFSEEEEEKLQAAFSLEKQELHLILEIISFILEQAVYHNVKPAALQQQLENIHFTQDKAEAFANAWSAMGQETVEKFRQRILGPHKLETVGWQLNLQMAHSAQAKLQSPQAVLQLGVSQEDSKVPWKRVVLLVSVESQRIEWVAEELEEPCILHLHHEAESQGDVDSEEEEIEGCEDEGTLVEITWGCEDEDAVVEITWGCEDEDALVEITWACEDEDALVEITQGCSNGSG
ncbi:COMM domain containing 10 [Cricetulus griseus]